jgi:RNA polymerase sigma factor (sigma-70 family)
MADATLSSVLRHVRRLSGAAGDAGPPDGELLHSFLCRQDADAFAALVRRHGPMVLHLCRRVLHHHQDAEDAFQATFLVLARKAASVRNRPGLAGWLHGAAYRTALALKRSAARRRAHEGRARPLVGTSPLTELAWREVEAILEEEIQRLPEKYRTAFALCCLEGLGRADVARRLGIAEGTLSSRLDHARKQLQRRLARRGVSLSAALAALALTQPAGAALPPALLAATARAAITGAVPANLWGVIEGVLRTTAVARLKILTALALTLGALAGWVGMFAQPTPADPPPAARKADDPLPAAVAPRADRHGDPLPPGALARLGTVRFRHGSTVTGLAYTPDGKTIVSGSYDKTVRVWDAATGQELLQLPAMSGSIYDLSLSADGKTIAAVDGTLCIGDLKATRISRPPLRPLGGRTCAAAAPDGKAVAAGGEDGTILLLEASTGKPLREWSGHKGRVRRVAFAPDGKTLASGGEDGAVRLWDVRSGKETFRLERKRAVGALAFSGDGQVLAAGDAEGKLALWRLPEGKLLHEFTASSLGLEAVAFSPDRKTVAASGGGNLIHLWDLTIGKKLRRLGANPWAIAFAPDGRTLASGGHDCAIRLWDVATGKERSSAAGHDSPVRGIAVSLDGTAATCGGDRFIRVWDVAAGRETRKFKTNTPYIPRMALSPDGKFVACNYCLWDRATGKELGRFKGPEYNTEGMAFSPDGRVLAMAGGYGSPAGGSIRLWDVATLTELRRFGNQLVHTLSYAPGGKLLAAGNADGTVVLWDTATGREVHQIRGHKREVNSVAFSPDGKAVASSSFDGDLFLWDAATGKLLRPFPRAFSPRPEHAYLMAVAFAPNGKMLATADRVDNAGEGGNGITLWDVATGRVRHRLAGHQGDVNAVAFAPGGRTLITGSTDTTALVWDVTGPPLPKPAGGPDAAWDDLLSEDAARAYQAMSALAATPKGVVLLGKHLPPAVPPDGRRVAQLLKALDSEAFAERDQASQELEKLGEAAEPALRQALAGLASLETRKRAERLLNKLDPEWLRTQRALEALELAGNEQAKTVLQALSRGAPEARRTREAKAALGRWAPRRPAVP